MTQAEFDALKKGDRVLYLNWDEQATVISNNRGSMLGDGSRVVKIRPDNAGMVSLCIHTPSHLATLPVAEPTKKE